MLGVRCLLARLLLLIASAQHTPIVGHARVEGKVLHAGQLVRALTWDWTVTCARDEETVAVMTKLGNERANAIWEIHTPANYRKPDPGAKVTH